MPIFFFFFYKNRQSKVELLCIILCETLKYVRSRIIFSSYVFLCVSRSNQSCSLAHWVPNQSGCLCPVFDMILWIPPLGGVPKENKSEWFQTPSCLSPLLCHSQQKLALIRFWRYWLFACDCDVMSGELKNHYSIGKGSKGISKLDSILNPD